jgi:hypothetical protein
MLSRYSDFLSFILLKLILYFLLKKSFKGYFSSEWLGLEKINKIAIGKELNMAEIKKNIYELEAKKQNE